jgi:hypothetical protein
VYPYGVCDGSIKSSYVWLSCNFSISNRLCGVLDYKGVVNEIQS